MRAKTAAIATAVAALIPVAVLAADTGFGQAASTSGLGELSADVPSVVGGLVNALLGMVGVIFFVLMIYAGFLWMTAQGNEDQIGKARKVIVNSIIGLVLVMGAYVISSFVIGVLTESTGVSGPAEGQTTEDAPDDIVTPPPEAEPDSGSED